MFLGGPLVNAAAAANVGKDADAGQRSGQATRPNLAYPLRWMPRAWPCDWSHDRSLLDPSSITTPRTTDTATEWLSTYRRVAMILVGGWLGAEMGTVGTVVKLARGKLMQRMPWVE